MNTANNRKLGEFEISKNTCRSSKNYVLKNMWMPYIKNVAL